LRQLAIGEYGELMLLKIYKEYDFSVLETISVTYLCKMNIDGEVQ